MSYRISESDIDQALIELSDQTGVCFKRYSAYGSTGVNIHIPNSAGCITTLIHLGTKKETFNELNMIRRYLSDDDDRFDKYKISNCTHRDSLNSFDGKKNVSVCHEITKTIRKKEIKSYYCSGCHAENLSFKDFKKSQIPITYRGLRNKLDKKGAY